jgi:hypothetical protein
MPLTNGTKLGPYAVTADGKRFLINFNGGQDSGEPLTLVTDWTAELKKKMMLAAGTKLGPDEIGAALGAGARASGGYFNSASFLSRWARAASRDLR